LLWGRDILQVVYSLVEDCLNYLTDLSWSAAVSWLIGGSVSGQLNLEQRERSFKLVVSFFLFLGEELIVNIVGINDLDTNREEL